MIQFKEKSKTGKMSILATRLPVLMAQISCSIKLIEYRWGRPEATPELTQVIFLPAPKPEP